MKLAYDLGLGRLFKSSGPSSTLLDGLVSYWTFDETSETRYDSHGNNDFTYDATLGSATGKNGNAASFPAGNSDMLGVTQNVLGSGDFTVSVWAQSNSATGYPCIFAGVVSGAARALLYRATAGLGTWDLVSSGEKYIDFTWPTPADGWHHYICGYDSSLGKGFVYVDNGVVALTPAATAIQWSDTFNVGVRVSNQYWDGLIDEMGVWSRVLTEDERAELYAEGAGKFYPFA